MIKRLNPGRILGALVGVMLPMGLLGCVEPPQDANPPPVLEAPRQAARPAPPPAPPAQASGQEVGYTPTPSTPDDGPSSATAKPTETQQATAPKPQQLPVLTGLTEAEVTRRFGQPTTIRKTPAANVWVYQDQACTLELFLFTDMRSGEQKVLTYQIGGGGRDVHGDRGCLERLGINGKGG